MGTIQKRVRESIGRKEIVRDMGKSEWYDNDFKTRDDFMRDFESKSQAFREMVLSNDESYKTVTTSDNTVFALDKKTGFLFIFRDKCAYDFLVKEDVVALFELIRGMKI